jgi:hypothetical protein
LSFNHIERIEGLETLVNLTDLSLYGNDISVIEGLEHCTKLEVLSLGRNRISDLAGVKVLRRAHSLRALSLDANPVSSEEQYRAYVITFVPQLHYLDFALIGNEERKEAKHNGVSLEELQLEEAAEEERTRAAEAEREAGSKVSELEAMHIAAAVTAYDDILAADASFASLQRLQTVLEPLSLFHDAFLELSEPFRIAGSHRHKQMEREMQGFHAAATAVVAEAEARTVEAVIALRRHIKRVAMAMRGKSLPSESEFEQLRTHASELEAQLTEVELLTTEKVTGMIDTLDSALTQLRALKLAEHDTFFRGMELSLKAFQEQLAAIVKSIYESYLETGAFPSEVPDTSDVGIALQSKENAENMIKETTTSMEAKLIALDEVARKGVLEMCSSATSSARERERERNRMRMVEVVRLRSTVEAQLDEWAAHAAIRSMPALRAAALSSERYAAPLHSAERGLAD